MVGLPLDEGAHAGHVLPAALEDLLLRPLVQHHVEDQDEHTFNGIVKELEDPTCLVST